MFRFTIIFFVYSLMTLASAIELSFLVNVYDIEDNTKLIDVVNAVNVSIGVV